MSTPEPPEEGDATRARGSHRAQPQSQSRSLLLPVLGVLAVLAALGLAGYMLITSTSSVAPDGATETQSSPTDRQSGKTKTPTTDATDAATKEPTKEPTAEPVPQIPVYVFNQTSVTGLAQQVSSQLEAAGWNVSGYDNWRGFVPQDTVYFYPGDRAAAQQLSRSFPGIGRVWPASSPMPGGALTVILAEATRK